MRCERCDQGDRIEMADWIITNLPPITVKQLRHSHATALLLAGEAPKVVQERLGHSSITVTSDIYQSVLPRMQRDAIDRLAAMMAAR